MSISSLINRIYSFTGGQGKGDSNSAGVKVTDVTGEISIIVSGESATEENPHFIMPIVR